MLAELALIMGKAFGKLFDQEFATCTWVFDPNFDDSKREIIQSEFYNNRSSMIEIICQKQITQQMNSRKWSNFDRNIIFVWI